MKLQDFVYTVIYFSKDGSITSLYDNNPVYPKGYELPDDMVYENYYLMITHKESGVTEITKLNETIAPLFKKGPVFLVIDKAAKKGVQTWPEEDKEVFDRIEFDRWYSDWNVTGIIEGLRKEKENEKVT